MLECRELPLSSGDCRGLLSFEFNGDGPVDTSSLTAIESISKSLKRNDGTIRLNKVKDVLGSCNEAPQILRNSELPDG